MFIAAHQYKYAVPTGLKSVSGTFFYKHIVPTGLKKTIDNLNQKSAFSVRLAIIRDSDNGTNWKVCATKENIFNNQLPHRTGRQYRTH